MKGRSAKRIFHGKPPVTGPSRQRGYFALLTSVVLLAACLLAIRGVAKNSVVEVRMTTNDQVTMEAAHAAEAAWNYGLAWYVNTEPDWTTAGTIDQAGPDAPAPTVAASNSDIYNTTVSYTRSTTQVDFVLITATATAASNPAISATVSQYVHTNLLLDWEYIFNAAPLNIDGCLTGVVGNPDIYPGPAGAVAVRTSESTDCLEEGHLRYHDGVEEYGAWAGDMWWEVFTVSRADMKAIADAEVAAGVPDTERRVVWVTSTVEYHTSWGSPTNPVILVFAPEANCPHVNGTPTHYGVIFVDSECTGAHGWGGTEVFGSVAINGDVGKYNANTEITDWSYVPDGDLFTLKADWVSRIPGSWRDF